MKPPSARGRRKIGMLALGAMQHFQEARFSLLKTEENLSCPRMPEKNIGQTALEK